MKNTFVVLTLCYWGKGRTIEEAARNCKHEGGKGAVVVRLILNTTDNQHKEIHVNGRGEICYPGNLELVRIVSPVDGHKVKLDAIIGKGAR